MLLTSWSEGSKAKKHKGRGFEEWGIPEFNFVGYSTDENLLQAKILEYYLENKEKKILVDYKSDTYGISLGEDYKISKKIIDWRYDWESGIDSIFMFSGEPLINYNGEWLPALSIKTDKNIIVSFTCSILCHLEETENSIEGFLNLIGKDIKKLQIDTVKQSIISNGTFETETENHIETYKLTKKAERLTYDLFEYTLKRKQQ